MFRMKYALMTSPCRHMESMQHAVTSKATAYFRRPHTFFGNHSGACLWKIIILFEWKPEDFFVLTHSHTIVIKIQFLKIRKEGRLKAQVAKDQSSSTDGNTLNNFNYDSTKESTTVCQQKGTKLHKPRVVRPDQSLHTTISEL